MRPEQEAQRPTRPEHSKHSPNIGSSESSASSQPFRSTRSYEPGLSCTATNFEEAGKHEGKAGKHEGMVSARQQAQQLKKQRFNKVINDIAANKAFFMSFVRHPRMHTLEGFDLLLTYLQEMKQTVACQEMVKQSEKRTEEATRLKRKRDDARFRLRLGQRHIEQGRDTELAKRFKTGDLASECAAAEAEAGLRKQEGVARSIGNRLHW